MTIWRLFKRKYNFTNCWFLEISFSCIMWSCPNKNKNTTNSQWQTTTFQADGCVCPATHQGLMTVVARRVCRLIKWNNQWIRNASDVNDCAKTDIPNTRENSQSVDTHFRNLCGGNYNHILVIAKRDMNTQNGEIYFLRVILIAWIISWIIIEVLFTDLSTFHI